MSDQAGRVLQAQPVALLAAAGHARELRALGGGGAGGGGDSAAFAPLSGGPGTVSSQDQKLRKLVEYAAVLICLYTVGSAVGQVAGIVAAAEMIKEKLADLEQFQSHEGFSWVVKSMPTVLMVYLVPSLVISGIVGLLYATCGCCAARANNSVCAFCFCCCSAWQTCGLCLALLTSIPTVQFLAATSGVVQAHLDLCDPSVCLRNTTDWPSNGWEDDRRAVDCFAQATWHNDYHPVYPEVGYLSSRCSNPLFLHCDHDYSQPEDLFECSHTETGPGPVLHWVDPSAKDGHAYFLTARGVPCPCESKQILHWQECHSAMKSFPSRWNVSGKTMRPPAGEVRACVVRGTKKRGHFFDFSVPSCDPDEMRHLQFVCAAASPKAREGAAEALRLGCGMVEEVVDAEDAATEPEMDSKAGDAWMPALSDGETELDFPFATVMPPEPLRSCNVNQGGIELWQLTREEAPRAMHALQAMNVVRIALFAPGVVLFGLAFWWGQLLWKQVSRPDAPIQQPLLSTMAHQPHEMQPVQQPLMVSGGPHRGNAPAVPGNDGV